MPILYVHGVSVRDNSAFEGIEAFLRRYVAPRVNESAPESVPIEAAFWGTDGVTFAWNHRSRPLTAALGQGSAILGSAEEQALALAPFVQDFPRRRSATPMAQPGGPISGRARTSDDQVGSSASVMRMSRDQRADLLAIALTSSIMTHTSKPIPLNRQVATQIIAADEAVTLSDTTSEALARRVPPASVLAQGEDRFSALRDQLNEAVDRVGSAPGFVLARALEELRVPLNAFVTQFTGDVFVYLSRRGGKDPISGRQLPTGSIPQDVLTKLRDVQSKAPDEPTVVLSHSMGGQIVYDAVAYFLPTDPAFYDIRPVDLWCACASQVGLFEEMKLHVVSDPTVRGDAKVPHPRTYGKVKRWLNIWDRNDILSYTAAPIFENLQGDDREFIGGASLLNAHGSYLVRPSFYKILAERVVS